MEKLTNKNKLSNEVCNIYAAAGICKLLALIEDSEEEIINIGELTLIAKRMGQMLEESADKLADINLNN